jgi:CheY-like chemotaxis protein
MTATAAASALEALQLVEEGVAAGTPYQLLLTDVHMPDVDGLTLVESVRNNAACDDLPIVLLTSTHVQDELEKCEQLRVAGHVAKPVKQSDLLEAITSALHGTAGGAVAPALNLDACPLPRLRILLAEDSLMNQKLVLGLLGAEHDVTVASDGRQAVNLVEQATYDVVLMDVQMPVLDGLEATRMIRTRERTTDTHVPIVAMTAHAMKGDRERCLAAGMDYYVSKPIRAARLFETLRTATSPDGVAKAGSGLENHRLALGPVVDWSEALHSVNGDRRLLRDIVEAFLDESPRLLTVIRTAIEQLDAKTLQRAAHTLKGSTRYFGASQVSEMALRLEAMGARHQLTDARDALIAVEREMARLTPVLVDYMRGRVTLIS